ncbi:MAG: hypothetical protein GY856_13035 [bacterium]|nr:hypothetical protein [bacterium]
MQTHEIEVVIPEDHRLTVEVPETVRSGPATLILVIPSEDDAETATTAPPEARGRLAALATELARDPRSFRELSAQERRDRLRRLRGIGRGLTSGSEEFARHKIEEIEIEERKFAR